MHEHLLGKRRPGLLEMPGVTPEQVGNFFEAAAGFYQHAPWKVVGDDSTIKAEVRKEVDAIMASIISSYAFQQVISKSR